MFLEYRLVTVSPSQTRSPDSGLGGVSCQGQGLPSLLTGQVKAPGAGRWPGSWIYPGCGNRRELLNEMASDHALGLFCLSQRMLACVCFLINLETSVDSSAAPSGFLLSSTHFLLSSTHNTHTSESSWFQRMCFIPLLLEDSEDPVPAGFNWRCGRVGFFSLPAGSPPSSCSGKHPHRALLGSAAQSAGTGHQQAFAAHATVNSDSDLNRHCHLHQCHRRPSSDFISQPFPYYN